MEFVLYVFVARAVPKHSVLLLATPLIERPRYSMVLTMAMVMVNLRVGIYTNFDAVPCSHCALGALAFENSVFLWIRLFCVLAPTRPGASWLIGFFAGSLGSATISPTESFKAYVFEDIFLSARSRQYQFRFVFLPVLAKPFLKFAIFFLCSIPDICGFS